MNQFFYKARNKMGALVTGRLEAESIQAARKIITNLDLILLQITTKPQRDLGSEIQKFLESLKGLFKETVKQEELIVFLHQFRTAYSVGMPVVRALEMIGEQTTNQNLKLVLAKILADVRQGEPLAVAFRKHPDIFDSIFCNLLQAGEASGRLDEILERISQLTEQQAEIRAKVKSALFYPKLVFFFIGVVLFVVNYFVIPRLKIFLASIGGDLPAITKAVVAFSDFCINYWYVLAGILGTVVFLFKRWVATESGRYLWDMFVLRSPVFGLLIIWLELNAFCIVLSLLLESGVGIVEALRITRSSISNTVIQKDIDVAAQVVETGGTLSKGLSGSQVFPPIFVGLVAMGEESGAVTNILRRIGVYYKLQSEYRMNNLSKLIEPILLVIIFAIVLVIGLAVFLPIWGAASAIRR